MVIASDGVWQVMSNDEVSQAVSKAGGDATAACNAIFARAYPTIAPASSAWLSCLSLGVCSRVLSKLGFLLLVLL